MKIFFDDRQNLHCPQIYFSRGKLREAQDTPARTAAMLAAVTQANLAIEAVSDFAMSPILAVHDFNYVHFLRTAYQQWHVLPENQNGEWGEEVISNIFIRQNNPLKGILAQAAQYIADGSAPIGRHTWTSAYWAAQTALSAADYLSTSSQNFAMAITRPSGHHARRDAAGGFCYLNNAAICAQYLRDQGYAQKVLIIDTDLHHGQGIQEIFYARSDVMYVSIHQDSTNFYPVVSGFAEERGTGAGLGYNHNFPVSARSTHAEYFVAIDAAFALIETYQPDVIIHVLGLDVYKDDPQSSIAFETAGFSEIASRLKAQNKPLLTLVEGGYLLEKLTENLAAFLQAIR